MIGFPRRFRLSNKRFPEDEKEGSFFSCVFFFFTYIVQKDRSTLRVIKPSMDLPTGPTKTLSDICTWAIKCVKKYDLISPFPQHPPPIISHSMFSPPLSRLLTLASPLSYPHPWPLSSIIPYHIHRASPSIYLLSSPHLHFSPSLSHTSYYVTPTSLSLPSPYPLPNTHTPLPLQHISSPTSTPHPLHPIYPPSVHTPFSLQPSSLLPSTYSCLPNIPSPLSLHPSILSPLQSPLHQHPVLYFSHISPYTFSLILPLPQNPPLLPPLATLFAPSPPPPPPPIPSPVPPPPSLPVSCHSSVLKSVEACFP